MRKTRKYTMHTIPLRDDFRKLVSRYRGSKFTPKKFSHFNDMEGVTREMEISFADRLLQ